MSNVSEAGGVAVHGDVCMRVAIAAGMTESIPLAQGDLLFLWLGEECPGPLLAALSLVYCAGRQGLRLWGKPYAASPRPP